MREYDHKIIEYRVCPACSEEFGINCRQRRKKYCDGCKSVHQKKLERAWQAEHREHINAQQRARYHAKKMGHTYMCELCGQRKFTRNSGVTKYCDRCLRKYAELYDQRRSAGVRCEI